MKDLVTFLKESLNNINESNSKTSFTFNFNNLPNAEDILKQLKELAEGKDLEIEFGDNDMKVSVDEEIKNAPEKINAITDVLSQYAATLRKDSKNASSESFAQTTKRFKESVDKLIEYLQEEPEMPSDEQEEQREKTDEE